MGVQLFTNNASSQLSGSLPQGGTTLVCSAGQGSRFPSPSAGDFFYLTLYTKDVYAAEQNIEIVKVTARATDVMTIVRDIEGITGNAGGFAYAGGADTVYLDMRWTAGCVGNMAQKGELATVATTGSYADLIDEPTAFSPSVITQDSSNRFVTDAEKSTWNAKEAAIAAGTAAQYYRGDKSFQTLDKAAVGLGSVNNTSDADKPVSTAQATAIGLKQDTLVSGTNIKTVGGNSLLGSGDVVLPTGDVTLAGVQTLSNKTITGLKEVKSTLAASEIDLLVGNFFDKTITAITTLTVTNVPAAGTVSSFVLELTNGGAFTITWWTGVKWSGGVAPTLTAVGRDVLGFYTHDGGTNWTGLVLAKDVK